MTVTVRIRYPVGDHDRARRVATLFRHPQVQVELVEGSTDELVIEGPWGATSDPTLATALLRRYMLARARERALRRPRHRAGDDEGARPRFYYKCNVNGRWVCIRKDAIDDKLLDVFKCDESSSECDMIVVNDIISMMQGVGVERNG